MADLTTGLETADALDDPRPHFRVTWVAWDSPFRATDLAVGDRIVAVDGVPVVRPADPAERSRALVTAVGQTQEYRRWADAGRSAGSPVALTVRRPAPASGWTESTVTARLRESGGYRNAENRIVLGSGGPDTMGRDQFSTTWGAWYDDRLVPMLRRALDPALRTRTFVTRSEWRQLGEHEERVAFAAERYPGAWSAALAADYAAARASCEGARIELPLGALDFRRRGAELAAEVRAQAAAAWEAARARVASETIAPFPAVHPVRGDASAVAGRYVVLPPLGNREWISEAGHGWFAAGSAGDGWYFLDAESEAAQAMLIARRRYGRLVDPSLAASFEFLARITGESRLVVVGERARFGLLAEPVAALVGGALFVDLAARQGTAVPFAGEDALSGTDPQLPPDDASPAAVLGALVDAVKQGDLPLWRALHASWAIVRRDDGRQTILPHASPPNDSDFEESRRSVAGRVLDARVAWVDDPVVVADGARFPGALHIEEIAARLDHYGEFDGAVRSFTDVTVRRDWTLQRVDGGPWRVAGSQPI